MEAGKTKRQGFKRWPSASTSTILISLDLEASINRPELFKSRSAAAVREYRLNRAGKLHQISHQTNDFFQSFVYNFPHLLIMLIVCTAIDYIDHKYIYRLYTKNHEISCKKKLIEYVPFRQMSLIRIVHIFANLL